MFSWKLCAECVFVYSFNYDAKIIEKEIFQMKTEILFRTCICILNSNGSRQTGTVNFFVEQILYYDATNALRI